MPPVQPRPRKVTCSASASRPYAVDVSSARTARACDRRGVLAEGGAQQCEGRRGEPRLDHAPLVDVVEQDRRGGLLDHWRPGGRDDRHVRGPGGTQRLDDLDHLGRRAGAGDHDDAVIATAQAVLRGGVGVGDALTELLPPCGIRLAHEPRRAAADRRDALAGSRQVLGDRREPADDSLPVVRLGGDLLGEVLVLRHRGLRTLVTAQGRGDVTVFDRKTA
jgi:hypothetical protein